MRERIHWRHFVRIPQNPTRSARRVVSRTCRITGPIMQSVRQGITGCCVAQTAHGGGAQTERRLSELRLLCKHVRVEGAT